MPIIYSLYGILMLGVIISSLFIIFHIFRYSYNKASGALMFFVFSIGAFVLIISNFVLFSSIRFDRLISSFNL
jgi:hypothetical protein